MAEPTERRLSALAGLEWAELRRWQTERIFERSVDRPDAEPFVFFEGPPTANARPALHHVLARVFKDAFARYQTMQGRRVERRAGWDTHGLPVEIAVERSLGLSTKAEVEAFGIEEFNELCRESVRQYVGDWIELSERIGYWADFTGAYWTLSPDYVQSVWSTLKQADERGLLYRANKVVPYCTRCETALSSHELGQPEVYKDLPVRTPYIAVRFQSDSGAPAPMMLVWTTTPWTVPSNVAIAVNPELEYAVVGDHLVARACVDAVFGADTPVDAVVPGSALIGLPYERIMDEIAFSPGPNDFRIVGADWVEGAEGTGFVHIAPAFGEEDRVLAQAEGLSLVNRLGPDGLFTSEAGRLGGRSTAEASQFVLDELSARGALVKIEDIEHSTPTCWRCGTELINWAKDSWFIESTRVKDDMVAANQTVHWHPEHLRDGRFGDWLAGNVDWAISRDRYWGTPIPIWECSDGHRTVVGSLAELSEHAGRDVSDIDPHRPYVDEITICCPDCGGDATRTPEVCDVWLDSGVMPTAQWGYPIAEGSAERIALTADFICEGIDQTRGWFYSLLAAATVAGRPVPYKNVLALGHIVDADGRKMSKSKGNVVDPWDIIEVAGADALRWWFFHQGSAWTSTRFSAEGVDALARRTLQTLEHVSDFERMYRELNGFEPSDPAIPPLDERPEIDRWLISRLHSTLAATTEYMDAYDALGSTNEIAAFIDDLSNWYVRVSRGRFWSSGEASEAARRDVLAAAATLHETLEVIEHVMAPLCPFGADRRWRALGGRSAGESIHLESWPVVQQRLIDPDLETSMAQTREFVALARRVRQEAGIPVRQPLTRATIVLAPGNPAPIVSLLASEINVDKLMVASSLEGNVTFSVRPNYPVAGPRYGAAIRDLPAALETLDASRIGRLLDGEAVSVDVNGASVVLQPDDVDISVRALEGSSLGSGESGVISLDVTLNDDLIRRGRVRELGRHLQQFRRDRGLDLNDRIRVTMSVGHDLGSFEAELGTMIHGDVVLVDAMSEGGDTLTIDGEPYRVALEVVRGFDPPAPSR